MIGGAFSDRSGNTSLRVKALGPLGLIARYGAGNPRDYVSERVHSLVNW